MKANSMPGQISVVSTPIQARHNEFSACFNIIKIYIRVHRSRPSYSQNVVNCFFRASCNILMFVFAMFDQMYRVFISLAVGFDRDEKLRREVRPGSRGTT